MSDTQYTLTIIVPVYNEQDNLMRVKDELEGYLTLASVKACVLFINDGSNDRSQDLIERICESNSAFNNIKFDKNYGLSAAIKAGFDHTTTPLIGYIDADLQTHPDDFELLLPYAEEFDLVTGVRKNRKDSFIKNMSSLIANKVRRWFTKDGMEDTNCPLKIIKADYAKNTPMFRGLHRFLPAMILLQKGRVKQVPVRHFERLAGTAKFGIWNRSIGPLIDCFAYLWMKRKYINYNLADKSK